MTINYNNFNNIPDYSSWVREKYLSDRPLVVHYQLKESIEESINVPSFPSLEGNITYNIGTTIEPSNIIYGY